MTFGMEEGLGPAGYIVLDVDPPPPTERAQQHPFSAHVYYGQIVTSISATAELLSYIYILLGNSKAFSTQS